MAEIKSQMTAHRSRGETVFESGPFDYIIVGAGSAGCVLAGELAAALPSAKIALLEAGGSHADNRNVSTPSSWPLNLGGPAAYNYRTVPQQGLNDRRIAYSRGKGLGGSSLINVMIYSRGFKRDWDAMPEGWRSSDMEPYFERVEKRLNLSKVSSGPFGMAVAKSAKMDLNFPEESQESLWASAGVNSRYWACIDPVTQQRTDIYRVFASAYDNVSVVRCQATRVLFDMAKKAIGIEIASKKGKRSVMTIAKHGEIILCAGAIDTPKCLQLSGVGPPELLRQLDIAEVSGLPVGHGLMDHPLLPCIFWLKARPSLEDLAPNSVQGMLRDDAQGVSIDIIDGHSAGWIAPLGMLSPLDRPGMLWALLLGMTKLVSCFMAFLIRCVPCLQILFTRVVGLNVAVVRPSSVGSVMITSKDTKIPPAIDPKFLSTDEDMKAMLTGVAAVKKLVASPVLSPYISMELMPGLLSDTAHVKSNTSTYYHSTGTCRLGSCLDNQLRVLGVGRLRVCDASALPMHPQVPTAAACMALGARCAEFVISTSPVIHSSDQPS